MLVTTLVCALLGATATATTTATATATAQEGLRPDILLADFEGSDYGDWTTTGQAFGSAPAQGTHLGQMQVSGYVGNGLVNSFYGGDGATGTLTSPPFVIERRFLSFLIGGGGYAGTTCVNLLRDGEAVRTATGPNTTPGGSEALQAWAWDLQDLQGQRLNLQVVDARTGGWGHINLDHVVLTDLQPKIPERPGVQRRELLLNRRFLLLPVRSGARSTRVDLRIDGKAVRQFDIELASTEQEISFWSFLDLGEFHGQQADLELSSSTAEAAALIRLADEVPTPPDLYDEALRPQLRFSQRIGWNNDPNGLVYADGEWHLYFQHNPYGWKWGNMHWGHAVSRDLVHWQQLPIAIYNRQHGDWAFSGGAVVDEENTSGWQSGENAVIVASWTSTGRGECLAYSNNGGRTFTEYDGNPVVQHSGRDPKIIWYAPGNHWVMVVYSQVEGKATLAFHSSPDLQHWTHTSNLEGYYECPELFELPVDGNAEDTRWVVFAADAQYALGKFDGRVFTPLHQGKHRLHYGSYYASQTFSNAPDGRRIQFGWARINMPDMHFNQAFSIAHDLSLRTTADGVRLHAEPVPEIESLREQTQSLPRQVLTPEDPLVLPVKGELFDVRARFALGDATTVGIDLGGNRVLYDVAAQKLGEAALAPIAGEIEIRILLDRPMLEIIGNRGRVYLTNPREHRGEVKEISAFAEGGRAELLEFEAHRLRSIWR